MKRSEAQSVALSSAPPPKNTDLPDDAQGISIARRLLALCLLALLAGGLYTGLSLFWNETFVLEAMVQSQSGGQLTGTLIEAKDEHGRVRLSAGVEDSYNTSVASDPTLLKVHFDDGNHNYAHKLMPKAPGLLNGLLFGMGGQVYAISGGTGDVFELDSDSFSWTMRDSSYVYSQFCKINKNSCDVDQRKCDRIYYFSDTFINSRSCAIDKNGVIWAAFNTPVFLDVPSSDIYVVKISPVSVVFAYYDNGDRADGLIVCVRRRAGLLAEDDCRRIIYAKQSEFPYAIDENTDDVAIFSNNGSIIKFNKKTLNYQFVRHAGTPLPGQTSTSYQIYASMKSQNHVMLGGYPLNLVQKLDAERKVIPFEPAMPEIHRYGEVQTLSLFKNRVFAGVWPWGQVWRFDPFEHKWDLLKRLFSHPDMSKLTVAQMADEPYAAELQSNKLGQRVNSFVSVHDSIYILTSAKDGHAQPVADKSGLTSRQIAEYGAVHRFSSTGVLSLPIEGGLRDKDRIRIELKDNKLRVFRNDLQIGETGLSMQQRFCLQPSETGAGLFGPLSAGSASVVREEGDLRCG